MEDLNPYKNDKGTKGAVSAFVAVTAARTVVMPFNYPFDTVRRRMMLQSEKPLEERLYKGSVHCFNMVLKNAQALPKGRKKNLPWRRAVPNLKKSFALKLLCAENLNI